MPTTTAQLILIKKIHWLITNRGMRELTLWLSHWLLPTSANTKPIWQTHWGMPELLLLHDFLNLPETELWQLFLSLKQSPPHETTCQTETLQLYQQIDQLLDLKPMAN